MHGMLMRNYELHVHTHNSWMEINTYIYIYYIIDVNMNTAYNVVFSVRDDERLPMQYVQRQTS